MVRLVTIAAVVMGVLILGGTVTLVALVVGRAPSTGGSTAAAGAATLDEPAGTRIAGAAGTAEALVLLLQGGGPDRVVVLDARTGQVAARVGLAR